MEATQPSLTPAESLPVGVSENFSLVLGGPLFQLLRKAHLEGDALELLHRRILASVLLTWVPLAIFAISSRVWDMKYSFV